ncbi:hypothetical protein CEP51_006553 [Fusarium floridanum]|uniref:Uncharacterized protein n=1 Tax=Fusarium floridanum TaxID=1325733 RepID=A0A428RSB6_9HYPO|nr:hypothetical protein CEP51_006553 [Fusarium floridanum]
MTSVRATSFTLRTSSPTFYLVSLLIIILFQSVAAVNDGVCHKNPDPGLSSDVPGNASEGLHARGWMDVAPPLKASNLLSFGRMDEECFRFATCVSKDDKNVYCGIGYKQVGWEACDKRGNRVKPICCKSRIAPKKCTWRGSATDCNGQCHAQEVTLFKSRFGGGFKREKGLSKCIRGEKAFCCEDKYFDEATAGCRWTGCGGRCSDNERVVAKGKTNQGSCGFFWSGGQYCCPKSKPAPLLNCHWVGQGDCAENTCADSDIQLERDRYGGSWAACHWGRRKALCCIPNPAITRCGKPLGRVDKTYRCGPDPYADESEEGVEIPNPLASSLAIRSGADVDDSAFDELEKRGKSGGRRILKKEVRVRGKKYRVRVVARNYPGPSKLHNRSRGPAASNLVFRPVQGGSCYSTRVEAVNRALLTPQEIRDSVDTEHNPDLQYAMHLLQTAMTGILPDGSQTTTQAIDVNALLKYWHSNVVGNLPRAGASRHVGNPNDYFMDRFGSTGNRQPLLLADRAMNQNRVQLLDATRRISRAVPQLARLHDIHREFDFNWYRERTNRARRWVDEQLTQISAAYSQVSRQHANHQTVTAAVAQFRYELKYIKPPPKNPKKP